MELSLWESSTFLAAARNFGYRNLFVTPGIAVALASGLVLGILYATQLPTGIARVLALGYLSLGAALLGIVLAGLAVVAAFFDPSYSARLARVGSLTGALFMFWWVAAIAVAAIASSLASLIVFAAVSSQPTRATFLAIATTLFFAALLETLALVGTVMRHGLYRAALHKNNQDPTHR